MNFDAEDYDFLGRSVRAQLLQEKASIERRLEEKATELEKDLKAAQSIVFDKSADKGGGAKPKSPHDAGADRPPTKEAELGTPQSSIFSRGNPMSPQPYSTFLHRASPPPTATFQNAKPMPRPSELKRVQTDLFRYAAKGEKDGGAAAHGLVEAPSSAQTGGDSFGVDAWARNNPEQYPQGNKSYEVPVSMAGGSKSQSIIAWAGKTVNSRTGKRACLEFLSAHTLAMMVVMYQGKAKGAQEDK